MSLSKSIKTNQRYKKGKKKGDISDYEFYHDVADGGDPITANNQPLRALK